MSELLHRSVMRDHTVHERPSTPLELLFDLCFVVAVAFLAGELHHGLAGGHAGEALVAYLLLFIPIWWAWMSYTWFATAFSHDDAITRVLTFAQMGGILAVAAAIPAAAGGELLPFTLAYAAMRLPLIISWLRSAYADPRHRAFALTYAAGSTVAQALWVTGGLLSGAPQAVAFAVALSTELATPVLAVRRSPDRVFHAGHIAERYGLFTIIVLGETILAVSTGLREFIENGAVDVAVLTVVTSALVLAAALWWIYFDTLLKGALERHRAAAFAWGYGHYAIFAAIAAVGAGVRAEIDLLTDAAHASGHAGVLLVAGSVAVVLLSLAALARVADPASRVRHLVLGAVVVAFIAVMIAPLGATNALALVALTTVVVVAANPGRRDQSLT